MLTKQRLLVRVFRVKLARNDEVFAGTILEDGTIEIIASKVGEDTTFGKIIELVEQSQDSKSKTERIINKFSKYYTPIVLLIGLLTLIFTKNIALSVTVLVLGCPGALVIGVPVSNVAGIGSGARSGILIKGSETINNFSNLDVLIFDKTGTLTNGTPEVVKEYIYGNKKEIEKAIDYLYSVELEQTHPLAKAIIKHIKNGKKLIVEDTEVIKGSGVKAIINNDDVLVGNKRLMESENIILISEMIDRIDELEKSGSSVVITAINKEVHIIMGIKDDVRVGLKNDIKNIYQKGIKELVILSGDNQQTVDLVATELGIKKAYGNMLPEDKANYIKKLQNKGLKIGFVGDGINDSPSLVIADIGIAMGSGTDIAIETSDVVLLNGNIEKLSYGLSLSRRIVNNIIQNITIAIGVVIVLITSLLYGNWLNMSIGMLIHELSILVVILNGMRLLRFRYKTKEV